MIHFISRDLPYDATDVDSINNNICVDHKIVSPSTLLTQSQNKIIDWKNAYNLIR